MPRRSNEFQSLVAYIYKNVAPTGATVTESAMLREGGVGTEREVDILISHAFLGIEINIAIECRGRGRVQDIEWIDSLAGKYKRLNINKVIAVSPTQFTAGAREKAAEERIELLTVEDASKVDWASRLAKEAFSVGTHRNVLLNVSTWSPEGNEITLTTVDPDTNRVTHKDRRSELLYPWLVNTFMQDLRADVEDQIFGMIRADLSKFFREPYPRYCELTWEKAGEIRSTEGDPPVPFAKMIFGIGTIFQTATAPGLGVVGIQDPSCREPDSYIPVHNVSRWDSHTLWPIGR